MTKRNIQLSAVIIIFTAMSSIGTIQAMGPYGPQPMVRPMPGQPNQKDQRKNQKEQIKKQEKMKFYQQNPRATDKDWDHYWDNYKRQRGLKD